MWSAFDPALFLYFDKQNNLSGLVCLHVDDELGCGNYEFMENVWNILDERLMVGNTEKDDIRYVGLNIKQSSGAITIDQRHYEATLELVTEEQFNNSTVEAGDDSVLSDIGQSIFKAKVGSLNWLVTQTRPDIAYDIMELNHVLRKLHLKT